VLSVHLKSPGSFLEAGGTNKLAELSIIFLEADDNTSSEIGWPVG